VVSESGFVTKFYNLTTTLDPTPFMKSQNYSIDQGVELNLNIKDFIVNLNNSFNYTFSIIEQPAMGTTTQNSNIITYLNTIPGVYKFKLKVSANNLISNISTITIKIIQITEEPILSNSSMSVNAGESKTIDLKNLISNYNGNLMYTYKNFGNEKALGSVSISGSILLYTANTDSKGVDKVEFFVSIGTNISKLAQIEVDVNGGLSIPVTLMLGKLGEGEVISAHTGIVDYNTSINISAIPAVNWVFKRWYGELNPANILNSNISFNIVSNTNLLAEFVPFDDQDNDGMSDIWEASSGGDLNPIKDDDNDGISNLIEYKYHANPKAIDSQVSFEVQKTSIAEGVSGYAIKLLFTPALTTNANIYLKSSSSMATLGVDFVLSESGTLSLNLGIAEKIIYVGAIADSKMEPNQFVNLSLTNFYGVFPGSNLNCDICILDNSENIDTDKDGMLDAWEISYFSNLNRDGKADFDGDGLSDFQEFRLHSNPIKSDATVDKSILNLSIKNKLKEQQ
jgi:hypothetical protein